MHQTYIKILLYIKHITDRCLEFFTDFKNLVQPAIFQFSKHLPIFYIWLILLFIIVTHSGIRMVLWTLGRTLWNLLDTLCRRYESDNGVSDNGYMGKFYLISSAQSILTTRRYLYIFHTYIYMKNILDITVLIFFIENLCGGRFHTHLRDQFAPLVIRYVDLSEDNIFQSSKWDFEKEKWDYQGYKYRYKWNILIVF